MPPDTSVKVFVPTEESDGDCFHSASCGAHLLEAVPIEEAVRRIEYHGLEPCYNCWQYYGLREVLYELEQHGVEFNDWP